jgi:hypothetical protein
MAVCLAAMFTNTEENDCRCMATIAMGISRLFIED